MNWLDKLYVLPGIIIGLSIHEYCHALAAYKLGDQTARDQGRLTFNPLKHIDPIGFLFLIIAGFGWAKPVQFNPENLSHPRRDRAIIAASGPISNFILALILIGIIKLILNLPGLIITADNAERIISFYNSSGFTVFLRILVQGAAINLGLFIFNLFPIPPLDGSHIVFSGLNLSEETQRQIMRIGGPLLLIILIVQSRTNITILPIGKLISSIFFFFVPELL